MPPPDVLVPVLPDEPDVPEAPDVPEPDVLVPVVPLLPAPLAPEPDTAPLSIDWPLWNSVRLMLPSLFVSSFLNNASRDAALVVPLPRLEPLVEPVLPDVPPAPELPAPDAPDVPEVPDVPDVPEEDAPV